VIYLSKFSIVISENFGYCFEGIFSGLKNVKSFKASISFLKSLGYDGVELPLMINSNDLIYICKNILSRYEMNVSAIATGHYYSLMKYSLNSPYFSLREKAIEVALTGLKICGRIQAPLIIGLLRGKDFVNENAFNLLKDALKTLDKKAGEVNARIVLEPLNRYETSYINTLTEAYSLIGELGLENTGIVADTFHMNIEEGNWCASLKSVKDLLWHVHIADSNRWPPGYGHINFISIAETLKSIGYKRWLAIECLPKPSLERVAVDSIRFLKKIFL
jgi:sugar phosphate isomerase/epimerase